MKIQSVSRPTEQDSYRLVRGERRSIFGVRTWPLLCATLYSERSEKSVCVACRCVVAVATERDTRCSHFRSQRRGLLTRRGTDCILGSHKHQTLGCVPSFSRLFRYLSKGWLPRKCVRVGADASTLVPLAEKQSAHSARISTVAFSPDSSRLLSCSNDGSIRIWGERSRGLWELWWPFNMGAIFLLVCADASRLEAVLEKVDAHGGSEVQSAAFSSDGSKIISHSSIDLKIWGASPCQTCGCGCSCWRTEC
jgi:WD40 repeat protein|eukprot:7379907-Prymnesium_polylepis.1